MNKYFALGALAIIGVRRVAPGSQALRGRRESRSPHRLAERHDVGRRARRRLTQLTNQSDPEMPVADLYARRRRDAQLDRQPRTTGGNRRRGESWLTGRTRIKR